MILILVLIYFSFPNCLCPCLYYTMSLSMMLLTAAAAAAKSLQLRPTLCDPTDCSSPGSPSLGFSRQEHWSRVPLPSPSVIIGTLNSYSSETQSNLDVGPFHHLPKRTILENKLHTSKVIGSSFLLLPPFSPSCLCRHTLLLLCP